MNFKNWMNRNYRRSLSEKGDLARHIHSDEKFRQNGPCKFEGWRVLIRDYLVNKGAGQVRLQTFDVCWKEYEQCERARLKMSLRKQ